MLSSVKFDKDYFENGIKTCKSLYENYRWMPTRSFPEAIDIKDMFGSHGTILDYGCAKGFLVKALRLLGVKAYGYDISEYAIANRCTKFACNDMREKSYDTIVCKDVLEHVPKTKLRAVLREIYNKCNIGAFIVVPLADGFKYRIKEYEDDITHVIREDEEWWITQLRDAGFKILEFDYKCGAIKEKWTKKYPYGNGFFWVVK